MQRLRAATSCRAALAWARGAGGGAYVAAADYAGDAPREPEIRELEALARHPGASDLRAGEAEPELKAVAERHGCVAAAPVAGAGGETLAVLLLCGDARARPRALAALEAAAHRLAAPLAAALRLERLEREARRLDRLAALGTLAGEIAHEVRNPLVAVKTFLQLLPERRDDPEFLTRFFTVVGDELRRMERLLDLVIDYGRPAERERQPRASLEESVESLGDLLRHRGATAGVRFEVELERDLPDAALGGDELRQIVLNLALNALAVAPPGSAVRARLASRDGGLLLAVSDEGPGVPAELRSALFEPFVSRGGQRPGGLGLAITRRIVEEAGGSIELADRPGGGSEFRVRLPAAPATTPSGG